MEDIDIVAQAVEADGGGAQTQATALGAKQALIDGIDDGQDKKQQEQHPEGQDKQIRCEGHTPQGPCGSVCMRWRMIKRGDLYIHLLILLSSLYLLLLHVPLWDRESKRDVLPILNDSLVVGRDLHHSIWMEVLATTVSPLIYGQITRRAAVAACQGC